ncbi:catalase-related domain-containing protein [Paraburkholderia youngii]|uniref:catalase-related domain-containing protein n=1 Tax=Paraburkholderia youngii TaxID=2782701 RepID=UPI003D25D685
MLFENTARAMRGVSRPIRELHIDHCTRADPLYGADVRNALEALDASGESATQSELQTHK